MCSKPILVELFLCGKISTGTSGTAPSGRYAAGHAERTPRFTPRKPCNLIGWFSLAQMCEFDVHWESSNYQYAIFLNWQHNHNDTLSFGHSTIHTNNWLEARSVSLCWNFNFDFQVIKTLKFRKKINNCKSQKKEPGSAEIYFSTEGVFVHGNFAQILNNG